MSIGDDPRDVPAAHILALNLRCHLPIDEDAAHAVAADTITQLRRAGDWGPRPLTLANTTPGATCVWNRCTQPAGGWRWDPHSRSYQPACQDHLAAPPVIRLIGPDNAA